MKNPFILSAFTFGLIMLLPFQTQAFEVIDQKAYRLDSNTALFAITYEFGFLNADLWMPMRASNMNTENDFQLEYVVTDESGTSLSTTNAGIVLSATQLERAENAPQYFVPKKERAEFMLIALVKAAAPLAVGTTLEVSKLPFVIDKEGNKKESHTTDDSVLEEYEVSLNN